MKTFARCFGAPVFLFALAVLWSTGAAASPGDSINWLQPFVQLSKEDFERLEIEYANKIRPLQQRLSAIDLALSDRRTSRADRGFPLLWERLQVERAMDRLISELELKRIRLRFRKGIEILKMLYEKILSMDHHFTSLQAQQEVQKISNPHNYQDFSDIRSVVDDKIKKKYGLAWPATLQQNPYLSAVFSIVGLMLNSDESKRKKNDWEKIGCILDFTVRVHQDLKVIYFETGFLKEANLNLKKDCETLFAECTRHIGYYTALDVCRNEDDWEQLYGLLDNAIDKAVAASGAEAAVSPKAGAKMETNLLFGIDRILLFVNRYADFVNQGGEYYKKFGHILEAYQVETACTAVIPDQFRQLKTDIALTQAKFESAYRLPEVQGSKLKDMLYGADAE